MALTSHLTLYLEAPNKPRLERPLFDSSSKALKLEASRLNSRRPAYHSSSMMGGDSPSANTPPVPRPANSANKPSPQEEGLQKSLSNISHAVLNNLPIRAHQLLSLQLEKEAEGYNQTFLEDK